MYEKLRSFETHFVKNLKNKFTLKIRSFVKMLRYFEKKKKKILVQKYM